MNVYIIRYYILIKVQFYFIVTNNITEIKHNTNNEKEKKIYLEPIQRSRKGTYNNSALSWDSFRALIVPECYSGWVKTVVQIRSDHVKLFYVFLYMPDFCIDGFNKVVE